MYKCTECGLEFEIKPEYCDCGNDEFVLTLEKASEPIQTETVPLKEEAKSEPIATDNMQSRFNYQKVDKEPFKLPVHPLALSFFILCLLLSALIVFAWNPVVEDKAPIKEIKETIEHKTVPTIDKIWKEGEGVNGVNGVNKGTNVNKSVEKPQEPVKKVTVGPIKKTTGTTKSAKTQKQSVSKPAPKQTQKTTTAVKQQPTPSTQNTSAIKAQEEARKAQEEAQKAALEAKQKAEAEARAAAEKAKREDQAKQELAGYKINLRNAIGQKIDFTKVIGDGDCIISFKLDSAGKLINRAFAKQSSNITLNNAVYNAVMAVPVFSPPPSAYKSEILQLSIRFTNGNFAITLK